ncbi:hypothetical protein T440DRAFT_125050 [Plenodomus tracheiphilus IPT5]|uniref:F5/8 type C domain-containing protein n=1 Tax=Plenodomus tracheiphilus IPT5 TaxID=1408161 RepID=A0A6A7B618_9PLEO|nr:hypothetical protein T440DRAFT_125050 [Plenodomus tracheiphilus IPT5]
MKRQSTYQADLRSFVLVCRQWLHLGRRIMYGNIALTNTALGLFITSFNTAAYSKAVHSLSLRIGKDWQTEGERSLCSDTWVEDSLAGFVFILPQLNNLASFSLRLELSGCSIPRATRAGLLKNMPSTCRHLEIDTRGQDHREPHEQLHVCDALRQVLPQLHHVRIRIGAMCCAMLGTGKISPDVIGNWNLDEFTPVALPNLKSLVLNCGLPHGPQMQLCGQNDWTTSAKHSSWQFGVAWSSITPALLCLIKARSGALRVAKYML